MSVEREREGGREGDVGGVVCLWREREGDVGSLTGPEGHNVSETLL